jgi:hypothetical protein
MKSEIRYQVREKDIVKISTLFHCLEDAIKELLRSQNFGDDEGFATAEMNFYEETGRALLSCDKDFLYLKP